MPSSGSIDGPRLAVNTVFNLAGQVLPLLAGIALIPYIIRGLGPDRFGMLGIIWVVFGYFSLMDFGLGRATTKFLAEWIAQGETNRVSEIVWSSVAFQVLLGVVGGGVIAGLTPVLVERVLRTPPSLVREGRTAFYILAATLPATLATNGLRGVLEGCQRFDITNLLRIPSSILSFVIPAVAIAFGQRLVGVVLWMGVADIGFTVAHAYYCRHALPHLGTRPQFRSRVVYPLLSFGGWITASNAVNPILLSMDRFLIGSLLSVAMVGYYTAPFEAVTKLWVIPASVMTTVYPTCSALGIERLSELRILYLRSIKYIFCALAPISVILILFAHPIIEVWLGTGFVAKSVVPLQLLTIGVFVNCFAHIPYTFLQALGRPDMAAKLFLCELVPYGLLLWWMIPHHGIAGAAAAWLIRVGIEVLLLLWITSRLFSISAVFVFDRSMWTAMAALVLTGMASYVTNLFLSGAILVDISLCAAWMLLFAFAVWNWVLDGAERTSALIVIAPLRTLAGRPLGKETGD